MAKDRKKLVIVGDGGCLAWECWCDGWVGLQKVGDAQWGCASPEWKKSCLTHSCYCNRGECSPSDPRTACGKTGLLIVFSENRFPVESFPTLFENYVADIDYEGKSVELALWDTSGRDSADSIRPLSYPDTDVLLICYSIVDPFTLENVAEKVIH